MQATSDTAMPADNAREDDSEYEYEYDETECEVGPTMAHPFFLVFWSGRFRALTAMVDVLCQPGLDFTQWLDPTSPTPAAEFDFGDAVADPGLQGWFSGVVAAPGRGR
jgi:hypothetical protein